MNYISATSIALNYTIPTALYLNNTATQYHCEVHNMTTGAKKNVAAGALTAATVSTTGSVAFTGLPTPDDGSYMINVYYADNADLDAASFTKVASVAVHKVPVVSTVTA